MKVSSRGPAVAEQADIPNEKAQPLSLLYRCLPSLVCRLCFLKIASLAHFRKEAGGPVCCPENENIRPSVPGVASLEETLLVLKVVSDTVSHLERCRILLLIFFFFLLAKPHLDLHLGPLWIVNSELHSSALLPPTNSADTVSVCCCKLLKKHILWSCLSDWLFIIQAVQAACQLLPPWFLVFCFVPPPFSLALRPCSWLCDIWASVLAPSQLSCNKSRVHTEELCEQLQKEECLFHCRTHGWHLTYSESIVNTSAVKVHCGSTVGSWPLFSTCHPVFPQYSLPLLYQFI